MELVISTGEIVLIDAADLPLVAGFKWRSTRTHSGNVTYAVTSFRKYTPRRQEVILRMHRVILDAPRGVLVDHVNKNGLDNRRANLRLATQSQNQANVRANRANTSGFKGVHLSKNKGSDTWVASIQVDSTYLYLGSFRTREEAAAAYDVAAKKGFGSFAHVNLEGHT